MNDDECRVIRQLYEYGASVADLADDYQVAARVIQVALLRVQPEPARGHVLPSCLHRAEWARLSAERAA